MTSRWRQSLYLPVILTLIICVPFLNKPFHIDDVSFLAVADQILVDPLRPHSRVYDKDGHLDYLFGISSSPLISYYYAAIDLIAGRSEVALHIGMMLFYLMLLVGTQWLCIRFASGSVLPLLFVAGSPAVITSGNVMMDIPAAGLAVLGVAYFVRGCDAGSLRQLLFGSLLAGLAILAKYSAIILLPLLAIYVLLFAPRRYLAMLLPALLPLTIWFAQNIAEHGVTHVQFLMGLAPVGSVWMDHVGNGFAVLGSSLFLVLVVVFVSLADRRYQGVLASLAGAVLAPLFAHLYFAEIQFAQFYLWAALGGATTALSLFVLVSSVGSDDDRAGKETLFLACWIGAVAFFSVFQVYFQAVRHVLPMLVPVALLLTRYLQQVSLDPPYRNVIAAMVLMLQAGIGFWVAIADYSYANTYRQQVNVLSSTYAGQKIWFGGIWGFKYYAENQGWTMLSPENNTPQPGDIVVIPQHVQKLPINRRLAAEQIDEYVAGNRWGVATMNGWQGAGFYAGLNNSLPYLFAPGTPHEIFRIYRALPDPSESANQ